jgi:hypothetical protein
VQIIHCTARRKIMEQSLIEKMKSGTCDEIDRDMISARVYDFHEKLMDLCSDFCDKVKELVSGHEVEMGLSGHAIVMGVISDIGKSTPIQMVVGRPNLCEKVYGEIGETLKEQKGE